MNLAQHLVRLSLRSYKLVVSPLLHALAGPLGGCRFTPTCSEYASEAVSRHGFWRGARLAAGRVCRCHPWGDCGHDPVPLKVETCSASIQVSCREQSGTPDLDSRSVVSFGR